MIERFFWIIWAAWLLMILIAACRVWGFLFAKKKQAKLWGDGSANQRPAVIIVAVKGFDPRATPRFFASLLNQNYSDYRIVVSYETGSEPVAQWLREQFRLAIGDVQSWHAPGAGSIHGGLKSVTLVEARESDSRGQKVHNQLAALQYLESNDEVIVFADADISCPHDWLSRLTAPINQVTHDLSTTYRWLVPKRPTFPNQLASIINASITTQGGSDWSNVLWGGSMAISRKAYDAIDVPVLFHGSLNDDLRLSKTARASGYKIAFVRSLILPTQIDFDWSGLFEFGRRQYTQVKIFSPILYKCTNLAMGFYVFGLLTVIAGIWYAYFPAWIPIAAAYAIDQFRAIARQRIYFTLFDEEGIRSRLTAASWMEHMLTPFWIALHWIIIVSTWFKRKIEWAGVKYKILSPSRTEVLERKMEVHGPIPSVAASLSVSFSSDVTDAIPLPPLETNEIDENDVEEEIEILTEPEPEPEDLIGLSPTLNVVESDDFSTEKPKKESPSKKGKKNKQKKNKQKKKKRKQKAAQVAAVSVSPAPSIIPLANQLPSPAIPRRAGKYPLAGGLRKISPVRRKTKRPYLQSSQRR